MKNLITILISILSFIHLLNAQTTTKQLIDSNLSPNENAIYLINGNHYHHHDSLMIDSILASFNPKHLVDIVKMEYGEIIRCSNNDIISIHFARQQNNKEIRKRLRKTKTILKKHPNTTVHLDNQLIPAKSVKYIINNLKIDSIMYILINTQSDNNNIQKSQNRTIIKLWKRD